MSAEAKTLLLDLLFEDRTREQLREDVQLLVRTGCFTWPTGITFDEVVRTLEREGRIEETNGRLVLVKQRAKPVERQKELF